MYHAHTIKVSNDSITISGDDLAQAACLPPLSPNSKLCITPWIGTLGLTLNDHRYLSGGRCLTVNHISAAQNLAKESGVHNSTKGLHFSAFIIARDTVIILFVCFSFCAHHALA